MSKVLGKKLQQAADDYFGYSYKPDKSVTIKSIIEMIENCNHKRIVEEIKLKIILFARDKVDINLLYKYFMDLSEPIHKYNWIDDLKLFCNDDRLSEEQIDNIQNKFIVHNLINKDVNAMVTWFGKETVAKRIQIQLDKYIAEDNLYVAIKYVDILCNHYHFKKIVDKAEIYKKYKESFNNEYKRLFLEKIGMEALDSEDIIEYKINQIKKSNILSSVDVTMKHDDISLSMILEVILENFTQNQITLNEQMREELNSFEVLKKLQQGGK